MELPTGEYEQLKAGAKKRASVLDMVKANPIVSIALTVVLLTTTLTATVSGITDVDALVVTQAELDKSLARHSGTLHAGAQKAIDDLQRWNRCDRLERRLEGLEDRLFQIESVADTVDSRAKRELKRDSKYARQQFDAFECGVVLLR